MLRIVHGQNSLHPQIMAVQSELADVYESQGGLEETLAILERNTEADRLRVNGSLIQTDGIGEDEG